MKMVGYDPPTCDVCHAWSDDVDAWCGTCGCCVTHCQQFIDCPEPCKECDTRTCSRRPGYPYCYGVKED